MSSTFLSKFFPRERTLGRDQCVEITVASNDFPAPGIMKRENNDVAPTNLPVQPHPMHMFDSHFWLLLRKAYAYLPALVTIISVPSSLNSSHRAFISSEALTATNFECSGFLPSPPSC